ncbi:hypothetical protein [Anatilimnocola floriformis]|uniref:hypothetical protein n=1 Tax=Anatilimnocola floriformis TaxID=2948575 RepID=UPI0020C1E05D|nr:hypothetical protein [Anatilimnocola floriformis]
MSSDARENYRSVFGVYPNEPKQAKIEPLDTQRALDFAVAMEGAANNLAAVWQKSRQTGISAHSQELLAQIQKLLALLREEIANTNSGGHSNGS